MGENKNLNDACLRLLMEIDNAIGESARKDRDDRRSRAERGWTPPPKGYIDVMAEALEAEAKSSG